ncbi:MAG: hypothetical protein HY335_03590 [Deinococcus sp.]|nr:hypothetical protein [Deinococcus sp.]
MRGYRFLGLSVVLVLLAASGLGGWLPVEESQATTDNCVGCHTDSTRLLGLL